MKKQDWKKWALVGFIVLVVGVLFFVLGKNCGSTQSPVDTGIDAGPIDREIDREAERERQELERQIQEIEQRHEEEIEQFTDDQRRKYESVRARGPEAVADWLTDFNRRLRKND